MGCTNSKSVDVNNDVVQSVIFYRQCVKKKEILIWDVKRARAWMLQRNWVFIEPPITTLPDRIRMVIVDEDEFESLEWHDIGNGIVIVFGKAAPPEPKKRKLMVHSKTKSNIHTISST